MTTNTKIKVLAEIVRGIIEGLHDAAPDHSVCPLNATRACVNRCAIEKLNEIIEG